jgi:hypothetical protein
MRIDARNGDTHWDVFHVPTCKQVKYCVWVDDQTAQYGAWQDLDQVRAAYMGGLADGGPPVHQASRILIVPDTRVVLIDPIEDDEPESVADVIEAARNAPAEHQLSPLALAPAYPVAAFSSLGRRELFTPGLRAWGFFFN